MNDGATNIAVGSRDGRVILQFPKAIEWAALDPGNALEISEAIARESYTCRYGVAPSSGRSVLSTEIRTKLVVRTMHVIRSLTEQGKSPNYVAQQVVDTILAEVM